MSTDILSGDKTRDRCFISILKRPNVPVYYAAFCLIACIDRMSFGYAEGKSNCTDIKHGPRSVVTDYYTLS